MWIRIFGRGRLEAKIGLLFQKLRGSEMGFLNVVSLPLHIDEIRLMWCQNYFDIWAWNETASTNVIPMFV